MPNQLERHEAPQNNQPHDSSAGGALIKQALTLYQCPDGSLVNHPRECKEGLQNGPIHMSNIFEDLNRKKA